MNIMTGSIIAVALALASSSLPAAEQAKSSNASAAPDNTVLRQDKKPTDHKTGQVPPVKAKRPASAAPAQTAPVNTAP